MVSPLDVRALRGAQSVVTAMHEPAVREALPKAAEFDAMRAANARFAQALRARSRASHALPASQPQLVADIILRAAAAV